MKDDRCFNCCHSLPWIDEAGPLYLFQADGLTMKAVLILPASTCPLKGQPCMILVLKKRIGYTLSSVTGSDHERYERKSLAIKVWGPGDSTCNTHLALSTSNLGWFRRCGQSAFNSTIAALWIVGNIFIDSMSFYWVCVIWNPLGVQ